MSATEIDFAVTRELVRKILMHAHDFEWTLQGFGMLRLYLAKVGRIHVWSRALQAEHVSTIHTHPWSLRSTIICGRLVNARFAELECAEQYRTHYGQLLQTGERGHLKGEPYTVKLAPATLNEYYRAGQHYTQGPAEIHESLPGDGCVTIMERPKGPDFTEHAYTYWPISRGAGGWISAEPRRATASEISIGVERALDVMAIEDSTS